MHCVFAPSQSGLLGQLTSPCRLFAILLTCVLTATVSAQTSSEPIVPPDAPVGLLVNGVKNPLAVDRDGVCFTWMIPGGRRGEAQTGYQILVASRPELIAADKADLWDSGKVASDKSASVPYTGKNLPTTSRFWWKVRVWNQEGEAGPYSESVTFDTGLPQGQWTARYIWDGTTNLNNFAYFRKSFTVLRKPVLAKVFVSAHNDYLLYLNGRVLGMGPGRCDPYNYGQYNAFDITDQLSEGRNVFAAIGHWHGNWRCSGVNAEPAFVLEARITFDDGTSQTIVTDASWKTLASTPYIETDAIYFGGIGSGGLKNRTAIQFDARREPEGWTGVEFDDSKWDAATVVDRSRFVLFAQRAALQQEQAELEPVSITKDGEAWLVDFGRCIDGWPKLTMRANRSGDSIRVEYFEMPKTEREATEWEAGWDQYTCRGGAETWKPNVGRHTSFQVLKVTGYAGPLQAADIRGVWAYTDADVAGRFQCSSELLNAVYSLCERSARQNVQQAMISVDANREQGPWLADLWNIGNVLLYNHRNTMILDKTVRDFAAEQLPCGDFYSCSPSGWYRIVEWSMYWPMLLWQQYLFSGDEVLLAEMAPRLKSFLDWLKPSQDDETKLINPLKGDWINVPGRISEWAGGDMPSDGFNIATNCQYYEILRIASRIFAVLGQTDVAKEYQRQADEVKAGINAHLFNGKYYLVTPEQEQKKMYPLASAWALRFDIVPPEAKPRVLAAIRKAGKPNLGGYGGDAFYNGVLHAGGMGDFVVEDLVRYRYMIESNGANHETFDKIMDGHIPAVNHAWTAYPGYLLQKYFSGIQPTSGGFSTFDVRPETTGLTFAESVVPTVKGLITTRWEKVDEGQIVLSVSVPANSRATVYVPKPAGDGVIVVDESDTVLWPTTAARQKVPGMLAVEDAGASIKCLVGAGTYQFTARLSE